MLTRDDMVRLLGPRPFDDQGEFQKYFGGGGPAPLGGGSTEAPSPGGIGDSLPPKEGGTNQGVPPGSQPAPVGAMFKGTNARV